MGLRCVPLMAHLGRPTHAPGRRLSGVFLPLVRRGVEAAFDVMDGARSRQRSAIG